MAQNGELILVNNGKSDYALVIPGKPSKNEEKSAQILQKYIQQITGYKPVIEREQGFRGSAGIYIGATYRGEKFYSSRMKPESFLIASDNNNVYLRAGGGKGIVYAAYTLLEQYWGCRKYDAGAPMIPKRQRLALKAGLNDLQLPGFAFRQAYYPAEADAEFLEWHKLHMLDDLFGLWGHSMHKIIPPKEYFAPHPEYFALVNGKRNAEQVDFTNEDVYKLTVAYLKKAIADNPDALYWSLSMGDGVVYDQGEKSKQIIAEEGAPSGPIVRFVNRVAAQFPDQYFTTLAYLWAAKPPQKTKPAKNVIPFLSNIDATREKPLMEAASAAGFRKNLTGWKSISEQVFLWDYTTQFTNYLAPFPDVETLKPNALYYQQNGITGMFAQGSGATISHLSDLKMYLQAKLLWNPGADANALTEEFVKNYYGDASARVWAYINLLSNERKQSGRPLDIYGNPVQEVNAWLSPEKIDAYSALLDEAEGKVEDKPALLERVQRLRLSLEYTVLQQSKYFGVEKFGFRSYNADTEAYEVKPNWAARIAKFEALATKLGVTELSEGGQTPKQYADEWKAILAEPYQANLALEKTIAIRNPFTEEWKGKGARTLIDGTRGYADFSYNWLLFYNTPLELQIDLGKTTLLKGIRTDFLDDPRHWIFAPATATIEVSTDGTNFKPVASYTNASLEEEHYEVTRKEMKAGKTEARYIRIKASQPAALPAYRFRENRKPTLAIDEVWVY